MKMMGGEVTPSRHANNKFLRGGVWREIRRAREAKMRLEIGLSDGLDVAGLGERRNIVRLPAQRELPTGKIGTNERPGK